MNPARNLLCFTNPMFLCQFDAILCDFQSDSSLPSWAVKREVSCLLYLYAVIARVCLRHVQIVWKTQEKNQVHNLEEVGQEISYFIYIDLLAVEFIRYDIK